MISLHEAFLRIEERVRPMAPRDVSLPEAVGCKLAERVHSPFDVPPFSNSAMDGIAVHCNDFDGDGPWLLPLREIIAAGDSPDQELPAGSAVKIMTGAPMAKGADAVIPVEEVEFHEGAVLITERPSTSQHVRPQGDDIRKGECLLEPGAALKPVDIGVLASIGLATVRVIPRPRVAVLSTGSEIVSPGRALRPGQIYNSNAASLHALLHVDGHVAPTILPSVFDDLEELKKIIRQSLASHHVLITTGGVSMGDFDYIPHAVLALSGEIIFHKVRVKPGKPVLLARFNASDLKANSENTPLPIPTSDQPVSVEEDARWLIGLPGNPVSVVAGYHMYVKRVLGSQMGTPFKPRTSAARLSSDLRLKGSRARVIGIRMEETPLGLVAHPSDRQKSGRLSSIMGIDGFVQVDEGEQTLSANTEVQVEWL